MKHVRIKKIITKSGKTMYYLGDGMWFGRVSAKLAEDGLADGTYFLFETVDKREAA